MTRIEGDKVVLKRNDDKEVTVPRAKLSDEDQAVLDRIAGNAESAETESDEPEAGESESVGPDIELTETDLSTATPVDLGVAAEWTYLPDPVTTTIKPGRIALPKPRDFFDNIETVLTPPGSMAYVVIANRHHRNMATRIYACDLTQRKLTGKGDFYANQMPLDVSADGKKLLSRSNEFGFGKSGTLYLYELDGTKASPLASWQPYHTERSPDQDVSWAQFVDSDQVLTLNKNGDLVFWDLADGVRAVYSGKTSSYANPVLSAGRKYLVARTPSGVALLKAHSGEMTGFLEAPGASMHSAVALRPDGKRLAISDWGRIRVWNLETQELERDFSLTGGMHGWTLAWVDDDRLVTESGDLVDVERRIRLWNYSGINSPVASTGETVWGVAGGKRDAAPLLIGAKLPHGAAIRAAEQLDPAALLVIRPGLDVSIKLNFSAAGGEQERVRGALTQRLEAAGMTVVANSPIELTASIKQGESQKVEYRRFGIRGGTSEHTVQTQILELSYVIDGKPVWTYTSQSGTPHMLRMQEGESIDQAIARQTKQNPQTFESIFVPGYVAQTPEGGAYGHGPWPGL